MKIWHTRTIKNGRVKINGVWYSPSNRDDTYDGRLDGMRFVFALYECITYDKTYFEPYIYCWGTVEHHQLPYGVDPTPEMQPQIVNGEYLWQFWYADKSYILSVVEDETIPHYVRWCYSGDLADYYNEPSYREALRSELNKLDEIPF